jgi:hypothetical protein
MRDYLRQALGPYKYAKTVLSEHPVKKKDIGSAWPYSCKLKG